jgi:hypothetical protein
MGSDETGNQLKCSTEGQQFSSVYNAKHMCQSSAVTKISYDESKDKMIKNGEMEWFR